MPKRVLIIDDEASTRMLVMAILESAGHDIREAENGESGLRLCREFKPDLVMLDLMMPDISGHDVVKRMRADPDLAGIAVLFCSASGMLRDAEQAVALGANDYLIKPYSAAVLLEKVSRLLQVPPAA